MIVGPVVVDVRDGQVRRSVVLSWTGGEHELFSLAPSAMADTSDDATAFLAAALPLAMRRGEDLEVHGSASPALLERVETIQECYAQWHPGMRKISVSASPGPPREPRGERGAFFSRGVDSLFLCARERSRLGVAVHVVGLEPVHDEHVREQEAVLTDHAAAGLDLELVVMRTNVRELSDPVFPNWEDFVAPGLAFCAHALSGGLRAIMIASGDSYATVEPCGTSPLLDPLYSSEAMALEHSAITHSRLRKVGWLAANRPDLLAHLKVCYSHNQTDNCGRCGKCMLTLGTLKVAGALEEASQFPTMPGPAVLEEVRFRAGNARQDWTELAAALDPDDRLRTTIYRRLEETRLLTPAQRSPPTSLRDYRRDAVFDRFFGPASDRLGLVRALDGERHRYGVGALPPGKLVGELGLLHAMPQPGSVPVWLTADGFVIATSTPPSSRRPRRARWVLAPLRWGGLARWRESIAAVAWRFSRARRPPLSLPAGAGVPVGYLHHEPGDGRLPLYSAQHPVTGDQMLSTDVHEPGDCGYCPAVLLGHLEARAPVTGTVGIVSRPHLVWASRFGQLVRPS